MWVGEQNFLNRFPRLFALEENKDATVAAKVLGSWSTSFRRSLLGGAETIEGGELEGVIQNVTLNTLPDKWVSDLSTDGSFSVATTRRFWMIRC